jgi:hypothetical protein
MRARNAGPVLAVAAALAWATPAGAHCDTLDGPVVGAARTALETGRVEHAMIWVQKADERAIRDAFERARVEQTKGGAAAERAEHAFYTTLVRVHRHGEGADFSGLKPAGTIVPGVAAADRAIVTGRLADVEEPIVERTRSTLKRRFDDVVAHRVFDPADVTAGRAYVGAYVRYVHQVEAMYDAAGTSIEHGHDDASGTAAGPMPSGASANPSTAAKPAHGH